MGTAQTMRAVCFLPLPTYTSSRRNPLHQSSIAIGPQLNATIACEEINSVFFNARHNLFAMKSYTKYTKKIKEKEKY